MNGIVEGFLRKASDKAEAQFDAIVWVAVFGSLALLVSISTLVRLQGGFKKPPAVNRRALIS